MFLIPITKDISLRLLMKKDAQEIFALVDQSRNYLAEWLPWIEHTTQVEDYHQTISRWLHGFAREEELHMGIAFQDRLVGFCGFHYFHPQNKNTSIGYWLGQEHQGKGIMTKTVEKMVELAFDEFQMNRVEIRCGVQNQRSAAIPKRLGFQEEGILQEAEYVGDRYLDLLVYGMTKQRWMKQKRK